MRIATEKQYGIHPEDSIDVIADDIAKTLNALREVNPGVEQSLKVMFDIDTK